MKVAIYGTGGVGGYFGGRLAQAGVDVSFVARGEHLAAMQQQGLKVASIKGDFVIHPVQASDNPAQIGEVDLVLVCVKGWQLSDAVQAMKPLVGENTVILPLLNGVDAVDILSAEFGANKVLNGLCGIFAKIMGPGLVAHMGASPWLQFGEQSNLKTARAKQVLALLESAIGLKAKLVDDVSSAVWKKFIFIASTSGVGSVSRATFGEMRDIPETKALLKGVIAETINVAKGLNIALPEDIEVYIWQKVVDSTPDSDTSMQRDILSGRPSELHSQTGAVIRLGMKVGVETPLNEMIYAALLPQELKARNP
ncbi:MAG: 2-dehydropantoate 2-reductase [Oceanospirillaceae bacterium]|nr:2-dehydropantoate 2-reductase [Oceanospirillaceae bacterium]